jgi:hypothetical protein
MSKKLITLFTDDSPLAKEMEQYLIDAKIPYNREVTDDEPKITTGKPMYHTFGGKNGLKHFKYHYSPRLSLDEYIIKFKNNAL